MRAEIIRLPRGEGVRQNGPQVEDGYTRIANELFEVVMNSHSCPVTLRQMRVLLAVIRKTYGFSKISDRVSDSQIAAHTGMSRQNVNKAKRELLAMNVLFSEGYQIGINKHYHEWDFSAKPETDNLKQTRDSVSKPETKTVSKPETHKRKKETLSTDVESEAPKKRQRLDFECFAGEVSVESLKAFAEHRKAMRSPLTQRALELTVRAASKAAVDLGITAEQAIDEAIAAGWKTVRTEWLVNRGIGVKSVEDEKPPCPHAELLAIWDDTCGKVKGKAPNLIDWLGTKSAEALAERWVEFYGTEVNGRIRYDSVEGGLQWWQNALSTIAGKQDFRSADIDIWSLFYKGRFGRAANGNLCGQGGASR